MSNAERPAYADYDSPEKFQAILGIIGTHLVRHPNAICSYSAGSDSDIMIDMLEDARKLFGLPAIKYVFFNTGLEMQATIEHVKATAERYGVEIETLRPKTNIVRAVRKYGVPFLSKLISDGIDSWQRSNVPLEIAYEYANAEDKTAKWFELRERYPNHKKTATFICGCNSKGEDISKSQSVITSKKYLLEFLSEYPPHFRISDKCCDLCKKAVAKNAQKGYEMIITGEREAEGGIRVITRYGDGGAKCFGETKNGQYRLRPLYYVTDEDKFWYKTHHGLRYSDAYEVYGLQRTGCCGCPISYRAVEDLKLIEKFEPNLVKAAWNVFGDSYRYRQKYNEYKQKRRALDKVGMLEGQISVFELEET